MKRQKPPEMVIFDCDGTLVDSEYLNNLASCKILAEEGLPQYDLNYAFEHFMGVKFTTTLKEITAQTGHIFPDNIIERFIAHVRSIEDQYLKPIRGAEELVRAASIHGKIGVASNGQRENVRRSLDKTGLLKYFDVQNIFTSTDVANPKPAPDIYLLSASHQNTNPENCVVIEDSVVGVMAGVAAGMRVYGFTGAHHNAEAYGKKLKNAGASAVYSTLIHIHDDLFG